jgi:hypothetical protein
VLRPEELLEAIDGQLLDLVDDLTAAVVPPAGIALGRGSASLRLALWS